MLITSWQPREYVPFLCRPSASVSPDWRVLPSAASTSLADAQCSAAFNQDLVASSFRSTCHCGGPAKCHVRWLTLFLLQNNSLWAKVCTGQTKSFSGFLCNIPAANLKHIWGWYMGLLYTSVICENLMQRKREPLRETKSSFICGWKK